MPIYEYVCNVCNKQFEVLTSASKSSETTCPGCGAEDLKRVMSTFASRTASTQPSFEDCAGCEAGYGGPPACGCMGACGH